MSQFLSAEDHVGGEWAEWYMMTPEQRLAESGKIWNHFIAMGGTLDPEPDSQSPFFNAEEWRAMYANRRPGLPVIRRH